MSETPWRDDPLYGGMPDEAAKRSWLASERRKAEVIQHPNQKAPPTEGEPRFKFRLLRDIRAEPPKKDWPIKGVFAPGETSAWIAPPGKLKSALIGEASFAIASNLPDWHGYRVKRSGAVIYFALERVSLVERRLLAEPTTINIVSRDEVDICDTQSKSRGWAKGLHLIRSVVSEAILESGKDHRVGLDGPIVKAVPLHTPRRLHKRQYVGTGDGDREAAERKAWSRNLKAAQDNRLISGEMHQGQELIWFSSNKP